jgi:hypothetical protein
LPSCHYNCFTTRSFLIDFVSNLEWILFVVGNLVKERKRESGKEEKERMRLKERGDARDCRISLI